MYCFFMFILHSCSPLIYVLKAEKGVVHTHFIMNVIDNG